MVHRLAISIATLVVASIVSIGSASAAPPVGFVADEVFTGLQEPDTLRFSPTGEMFIAERTSGRLRIALQGEDGEWSLESQPFHLFGVPDPVRRSAGVRDITFDPDYATNGKIYVFYMDGNTLQNKVVQITRSLDPLVSTGSELVVFDIPFNNSQATGSHNGGALVIGDDNLLYVSTGDGWEGCCPGDPVQSLSSFTGKILRIGTDGSIPSSNPFYTSATGDYRAIYSLGLRNPFTMSKHPETGVIYVNEAVGFRKAEIFIVEPGANYGHEANGPISIGTRKFAWANVGQHGAELITGGVWYPDDGPFPEEYHGSYITALWGGNQSSSGHINYVASNTDTTVYNFDNNVGKFDSGGLPIKPVMTQVGPDGHLYYILTTYVTTDGTVVRVKPGSGGQPDLTALNVNFQTNNASTPTGWVKDDGSGFSTSRGYGWVSLESPASTGKRQCARRGVNASQLLDTMCRANSRYVKVGSRYRRVDAPAVWEAVVPNGTYRIEVSVGDAKATSKDQHVQAEGVVLIGGVTLSKNRFRTGSQFVDVVDGKLTLTFDGSVETKLNSVSIAQQGDPAVDAPAILPESGSFSSPVEVTMTTETAGASIYYTVDGSQPSDQSLLYSEPFTAGTNMVIQAVSVLSGQPNSATTAVSYAFEPGAGNQPPVVSAGEDQAVAAGTTVILNGSASYDPDGDDDLLFGETWTQLSGPPVTIVDASEEVASFFAQSAGVYQFELEMSDPFDSATDTMTVTATEQPTVTAPVFSPDAGTYTDPVDVTMTSPTAGAAIYYTLDGTQPSETSTLYTAPLTVGTNTTVKAVAILDGYVDSDIHQGAYVFRAPGLSLKYNFQSANGPAPNGWLKDAGAPYDASRGDGWVAADGKTRQCAKRNINNNLFRDTMCRANARYLRVGSTYQRVSSPAVWNVDVPDGTYLVEVSVGDARAGSTDQYVQAEGTSVITNVDLQKNRFHSASTTVAVTDGKLTLSFNGSVETKLNTVTITRQVGGGS